MSRYFTSAKSGEAVRRLLASASILMISITGAPARAQTNPAPVISDAQYGEIVNQTTVGILGDAATGTSMRFIDDMASVIDDGEKLRILPIVGKGGAQNLLDLLYLKGVDLALLHADALTAYADEPRFRNLDKRVCYVAMLYVDELHVLSDKLTAIEQLKGKTVAYPDAASREAGERLLEALNIKPKQRVEMAMLDAVAKMKAGDVQAIIRIAAKPMSDADQLLAADDALHLIKVPFSRGLSEDFQQARFVQGDYDALMGGAKSIDTVGIGVVLAAFNWSTGSERYKRVARLIDAFFGKFAQIAGNARSQPKWQEVNLQAQLPGWQRCPAAEEALASLQNISQTASEATVRSRIKEMAPNDPAEQEKLFKQFLEWLRNRKAEDLLPR
jgi:uncharacterized protein